MLRIFTKIIKILHNIEFGAVQRNVNLVDLENVVEYLVVKVGTSRRKFRENWGSRIGVPGVSLQFLVSTYERGAAFGKGKDAGVRTVGSTR